MQDADAPQYDYPLMEDDAPLFETQHGSVLRCACCGRVQVTFAGAVLLVDVSDFRRLYQTVRHARREIQRSKHTGTWWRLTASTEAGTVSDVFRGHEIASLHELLEGAAVMLELKTMLRSILAS